MARYHVGQVLDRSVFPKDWTSRRLLRETIYLEDATNRFELKRYPSHHPQYKKNGNYCLSIVKPAYITTYADTYSMKIPLDTDSTVPLYDQISWYSYYRYPPSHSRYDVIWGISRVTIKGFVIHITNLAFIPNSDSKSQSL